MSASFASAVQPLSSSYPEASAREMSRNETENHKDRRQDNQRNRRAHDVRSLTGAQIGPWWRRRERHGGAQSETFIMGINRIPCTTEEAIEEEGERPPRREGKKAEASSREQGG